MNPGGTQPAAEQQEITRYRLTFRGHVTDELEVDDHLLLMHGNRVIALAGLTRALFAEMHASAVAGATVRDSCDVVRDLCVRHGADELPTADVLVAVQELVDLDLLSAEIYPEDVA